MANQRGIHIEHALHRLREQRGIVAGDQPFAIGAENLVDAADIGGDHRDLCSGRFETNIRE